MNRKLFLATLLLIGAISSKAGNGVSVSSAMIPQGGIGTIDVDLENDDYSFTAFSFDLTLPEGVSFVVDENEQPTFESSSRFAGHSISSSYNSSTRRGIFTCISLTGAQIAGTSGNLLKIYVSADPELATGQELDAKLTKVEFTTMDAERVNFDDISFKIMIDDGRIRFDESSSILPRYTAGEKGDVTMKRTIKKEVWNTIVLPFNLTSANAKKCFGNNVQFAQFDGFEVDYGDDEENLSPLGITINFSSYTIPARGNLKGGTPVLIKTDQDITEIKLDGVTLTDVATPVEKADEYDTAGKFTGSLVKTVVPADGLFISDNKFWYSTGKTNIKAFRGWFELGAVIGKDTDFGAKIRFVIDDAPTSIEGIESANVDGDVYTLQGIYVGRDVEKNRLPKGIYIIDGKKTFVK